ncbi:MAG: thioredoxin family protein [Spirochaetota bacterium]|nr:thioredoxin family protein [Spirochaetota bacterium]
MTRNRLVYIIAAVCVLGAVLFIVGSPPSSANIASAAEGAHGYVVLNDSNFARETAGKLVFIDFYADWCPPCVAFAPVFAAVSAEVQDGFFVKVDVDDSPKVSAQFGIQFIPYIVAVKDGKVLAQFQERRTAESYAAWCREQMRKQDP